MMLKKGIISERKNKLIRRYVYILHVFSDLHDYYVNVFNVTTCRRCSYFIKYINVMRFDKWFQQNNSLQYPGMRYTASMHLNVKLIEKS